MYCIRHGKRAQIASNKKSRSYRGLNSGRRIQSPVCYHYTIGPTLHTHKVICLIYRFLATFECHQLVKLHAQKSRLVIVRASIGQRIDFLVLCTSLLMSTVPYFTSPRLKSRVSASDTRCKSTPLITFKSNTITLLHRR